MNQFRLFIVMSVCLTLKSAAFGQTTQPEVREHWSIIMLGEDRVGYSRVRVTPYSEGRQRLTRSTEETRLTLKRFGQVIKMVTKLQTIESENGTLKSFELQTINPPAESTNSTGVVENNRLRMTTLINGKEQTKNINWDSTAKAPGWQDRTFRDKPLKPGERRNLRLYIPAFAKVSNVQVIAGKMRQTTLFDGSTRKLLQTTIKQSILPAMPTTAWIDEFGQTLRSEADFLGTTMTTYRVPADVALQQISGAELDIAVNTLIRLEKPLRSGHRSQKAVYKITVAGEGAAASIPQSDSQLVKTIDAETVEVTIIKADKPTGKRHIRIDDKFLKQSPFLQINDGNVRRHAMLAAGGETNTWKVCLKMEKYVQHELKTKNFSTALASAAEVAKTMEGDCTEHAILLAAMLRSQRIPSRVAVGIVYIENQVAFGGHMWTEAYVDGRWIALDPTLGIGGIGVAHIKLAECDFTDDTASPVSSFLPLFNLMGNMKIEVVSSE